MIDMHTSTPQVINYFYFIALSFYLIYAKFIAADEIFVGPLLLKILKPFDCVDQ